MIENFEFISNTKIIFGKDKEKDIGKIISSYGFKKVLLVYGGSSIKKIGLYEKLINSLSENKISFYEFGGIRPNPNNVEVSKGIQIAKENNVDFVLAVGGGSVIDVSKAIACGYFYEGDPFDFVLNKATPKKALKIGVILTLAASGSELSRTSVFQNDEVGFKGGYRSDFNIPLFSIMNPEITFSVNKFQTGCGVVDIIAHSLERYFCPSDDYEFADELALAIIKNMIKCGKRCIEQPTDYKARAEMMLCGSYSHNGLTSLGKNYSMTVHTIEHALSAFNPNIAHGAGLSILIPGWMEYVYKYDVDKFAKFSKEVFNLCYVDKNESAKIGIQYLKNFFKDIGMPIKLSEINIKKEDIPLLADMICKNGTLVIGQYSIKPLNKDDVMSILLSLI